MDKKEFSTFVMALRTYYPKEQILPNEQAMALWFRELRDIPADVAEATLRKWVSTNKWSPSIAEIRAEAATIQNGKIPDWTEAWERVLTAVSRYGMYRVEEALDSLDPLTRRVIGRVGFKRLCMSTNEVAERANFRNCYEQIAEREHERQLLALPLQESMNRIRLSFADDGSLRIGIAGGEDEA